MSEPPINNEQPFTPTSGSSSSAGSLLPFVLSFLVLFLMAYGGWTFWRVQQATWNRGQAISEDDLPGPPLTEFELTERSGKPFRSSDMRGRVWVASYFFATCPGNCVRLNKNIQYLASMPDLKDVTWVSITCDPDNDTLEVLRKYADTWEADPERWLFCRADMDYTKRVARGMNLFLARQGHQDYGIVIDKSGKIRGVFDALSRTECQKMKSLLLKLIDEQPPENVVSANAAQGKSS